MALSVTALAAALPGFREMLFGKGSPVADSLMPVVAEGEQDGIRLEVLGAMGDKSNVVAYFTLQDKDGLNRLSGDMKVAASAKLNDEYPEREDILEGGIVYHTSILDYDEETQTAFCRFEMTTGTLMSYYPGYKAEGEPYDATNAKIRLRVKSITTNKETFEYLPLEFSAEDLTTETLPVARVHHDVAISEEEDVFETTRGFFTIAEAEADDAEWREWFKENNPADCPPPIFEYLRNEAGDPIVLKPGEALPVDGPDFAQITAVGFIDGRLHIQYKYYDYKRNGENQNIAIVCADAGQGEAAAKQLAEYNHFESFDAAGESQIYSYKRMDYAGLFDFDSEGQVQWGHEIENDYEPTNYSYTELVYDIGPEELENYEFFLTGKRSRNTWADVSAEPFTLAESLPENTLSFGPVETEGFRIEAMDVTPIGLYLTGTRSGLKNIETVELICGEKSCSYRMVSTAGFYNYSITSPGDLDAAVKLVTDSAPVDPREITAVRINGEEIPLA